MSTDIPIADFGKNRLIGVNETAILLGISERYARKIFDTRRVPTVKIGRSVRAWTDDLAAYLTANTRPASAEVTR